MAVVINEFEVVPEGEPAPIPSAQNESTPALAPSVMEVERVLICLAERAARVWAH